jgi:hypothetical protein
MGSGAKYTSKEYRTGPRIALNLGVIARELIERLYFDDECKFNPLLGSLLIASAQFHLFGRTTGFSGLALPNHYLGR